MNRSTTSLAVALWGTVMGCCLWGIQASQTAAFVTVPQKITGAEQPQQKTWQQELTRSLTLLLNWSDLSRTPNPDSGELRLYVRDEGCLLTQYSRDANLYSYSSTEQCNAFPAIRNRWSHGFH